MKSRASTGKLLPVRPPYDLPARPPFDAPAGPARPRTSGTASANRSRTSVGMPAAASHASPSSAPSRVPACAHSGIAFPAVSAGLLPLLGHALLAGGVVALPAQPARAGGIDAVQLKLAWQLQQPLRWDNVQQASPYWLDGVPPQSRPGLAWQVLQLAPGQRVPIRVPGNEILRLQALPGSEHPLLASDDLQVWRSSGSGSAHALALREPVRSVQQGAALLVDAPVDETRVLIIERPAGRSGALAFGIFVSRHEAIGTLAPYRDLQPLNLPQQQLHMSHEGAARPVWAFAAGEPTRLRVHGPARFALSGRWQYPPQEGALQARWQVEVRRGGQRSELAYSASGEQAEIARLDGQSVILSEEKSAYFEVPAGAHELELVSSGPFLARLLRQELNDYRFANWNAALDLSQAALPAEGAASPWQMSQQALQQAIDATPDQAAQAAQRLQQDNRHRDGGLLAAAVMAQAAAARRDVPAVREQARDVAAQALNWQDLLPQHKQGSTPAHFAWFRTPRLLDIGARQQGKVIALQHEQSLLDTLGSGHFFALESAEGATAQRYVLPPRSAASRLQLAVHAAPHQRSARLFVQFDQQAPQELRLDSALPEALLAPDSASAGLQLQAWRTGEYGGSTVDASFGIGRTPAALIGASVLELPLPAGVSSVQVWRKPGTPDAANGTPAAGIATPDAATATPGPAMRIALRLQVARPFALAEHDLLHMAGKADGLAALMRALDPDAPASSDPAVRQLDSQLQGLARLINAQYRLWANTVANTVANTAANTVANTATNEAGNPARKTGAYDTAARAAAALAAEGNWLPALEKWASVAASDDAALRAQAAQGRIDALLALGETWLAEQMLKQRLLYGSERPMQQQAAAQLAALYQANGDPVSALTLASTMLVRWQDGAALRQLVQALNDNDQADLALQAGLLLPPAQRPLPLLLQLALQSGRLSLFAQLRASLPDAAAREFWLGQQLAREGKLTQAATSFAISARLDQRDKARSSLATALAQHLQAGQDLQRRIARQRTRAATLPDALLTEWAAWQAAHPGPQQWQTVPGQVRDFAGTASLLAINRDLLTHAFRAEPGKPLRMRFMGPQTLRVEARPLHAAQTGGALEGWLQIAEKHGQSVAQLWPVAINQNWPASGLQLVGANEALPGQAVRKELRFGPGWHELEIDGGALSLLLDIKTAVPALPLPVLPLLTPDTARGQGKIAARPEPVARFSPGLCRACTTVLLPQQAPLQLQRATPPVLAELPDLADLAEAARGNEAIAPTAPPATTPDALAALLARRDWEGVLALPDPHSPDEVMAYLSALLWRSEQAPQRGNGVLARASSLQAAHPQLAGLGALMERLARNSDWVPVTSVQASAGMRSRPVNGWEPETPALRVRRALLASLHPEETLLAGGNRLLLTLFNPRPASATLLLANREVGGLPTLPLTAQVQVGNGPPQSVLLPAGAEGWRLPLSLPKGQQHVRIWIRKPLANQFLGARLLRAGGKHWPVSGAATSGAVASGVATSGAVASGVATSGVATSGTLPPALEVTERFYHVATRAEPIRLMLPGPVWLRVDHWVNGQTRSRYRLLDQAWNQFSLQPREGEAEGLYRLFTRQLTPARPVTPARHVEVAPLPVAPPLVQLAAAAPPALAAQPRQGLPLFAVLAGSASVGVSSDGSAAPLQDRLPLGGQESGTWSLYGSAAQAGANALTGYQAGSRALQPEGAARWRWFDPARHNWYRAEVFARGRGEGGLRSLGFSGALTHDPAWHGLEWGLDASLLLRQREHNQAGAATLGASAFVRQVREIAPKWSHQPQLSLFLRQSAALESLGGDAAVLNGASDAGASGVGVGAGARRKIGLEVGDKLDYRPRLDTLLSSQIKATSGKSLMPESLALRFGGKQMLGPLVVGAQFDAAHFLADGGRIPVRTLRSVAFNAHYEHWLARGQRLEWGINLRHDLNRHRLAAAIGVALHLGNGRGYRDFAPGEISFQDLRRRRMPEG